MDISSVISANTQPAAASASTATLNTNFNTFLTLLTTQLQNQDPLEPLNTNEFTQQLVQFSGVEQSIQTNDNLKSLIALQSSGQRQEALGYVGRTAMYDDPHASLENGDAQWNYNLPEGADSVDLNILDANGQHVATLSAKGDAGEHTLVWNGETDSGAIAPDGVYKLEVAAKDDTGAALTAGVAGRGVVSGVSFESGKPLLQVGKLSVDVGSIIRVLSQ